MARFYFDITYGDVAMSDDTGLDLPTAEVAAKQALRVLPDVARDALEEREAWQDIGVNLRDETGQVVFTASLSIQAQWLE